MKGGGRCLRGRGSSLSSLSIYCSHQLKRSSKKTEISIIPREILSLQPNIASTLASASNFFPYPLSHLLSDPFTYLLIANSIVSLDLQIEPSGGWKSRRKYHIHALRMYLDQFKS